MCLAAMRDLCAKCLGEGGGKDVSGLRGKVRVFEAHESPVKKGHDDIETIESRLLPIFLYP